MSTTDDHNLASVLRRLGTFLAPILAPHVAKELRKQTQDDLGDPWIDQTNSPLGRRAHCRACKEGKIEGARKVQKKWLARKSAVDAYVEKHGGAASPTNPEVDDEEAAFQAALRAHGLVPVRRPAVPG